MDKNQETSGPDQAENEEKLLNMYMQELVSIQDNRLLTAEDLKKLDEKYPLSPQYKEKLFMLSSRHLSRAEQYIKQERWDTAIIETERALLFSPLDEQMRLDLAELYLNRSRQYGYLEKDLRRADEKIKETLVLHPRSKAAVKMQKEMQDLYRILKGKDQNRKFIPLIAGVLLILAAVSYPRIRQFSFWNNKTESPEEYVLPTENTWTSRTLKVETTDSLKERIDLDITRAEIRKEETGFTIAVQGYARSVSGPLEEIALKVKLGDYADRQFEKTVPLLDKNSPPLFPDETLPFGDISYLLDFNEETDSLFIELDSIRKSDRNPEDQAWQISTTQWEIPKPEGINLQFHARREKFLEGYDAQYLYQDIRVENRSLKDISDLNISIHWLDDRDNLLASRNLSLIPPGNPSLKAESIQTYRVLLDLSKSQILPPANPAVSIQQIKDMP